MPVSPETGWQHPPTSRGDSADASPLRAESDPESVERVSHMGQMTLSEFQVSPFQGIMCVNAPVTLSSPLNNLVISRLFNLLQPISTLFNYLCLVTLQASRNHVPGIKDILAVLWCLLVPFLCIFLLRSPEGDEKSSSAPLHKQKLPMKKKASSFIRGLPPHHENTFFPLNGARTAPVARSQDS